MHKSHLRFFLFFKYLNRSLFKYDVHQRYFDIFPIIHCRYGFEAIGISVRVCLLVPKPSLKSTPLHIEIALEILPIFAIIGLGEKIRKEHASVDYSSDLHKTSVAPPKNVTRPIFSFLFDGLEEEPSTKHSQIFSQIDQNSKYLLPNDFIMIPPKTSTAEHFFANLMIEINSSPSFI